MNGKKVPYINNVIDLGNETNKRLRKIEDLLCCREVPYRSALSVTATITADTDIVAAVPGKKIVVLAYSLITTSTTANTVTFKSGGTSGTALWTVPLQALTDTNFGANLSNVFFSTNVGEKLTLDVTAAVDVTYSITYILV